MEKFILDHITLLIQFTYNQVYTSERVDENLAKKMNSKKSNPAATFLETLQHRETFANLSIRVAVGKPIALSVYALEGLIKERKRERVCV